MTLVEHGDFECPFCGRAYPIVETVRAEMGQPQFVFRHFPLTTVHPHAEQAAEAAEAAGVQGAFWPMHAMLYENQRRLATSDLHSYAEVLGSTSGVSTRSS